ncbi:MAG: DUF6920 family protein [Ktedonobacteraceae bacterium]
MKHTIHHEAFELLQRSEQAQPSFITEAQVLGLPEIMQRYLRYTGVVGKESIRTVHLKQKGFMRQQPSQKWLPLLAEQYFTTTPPAFLWHGTIWPFPLVSMSATDRFSDGHGNMLIKLWSFITVGDARGPEMDQGELQRYLGEMVWCPTAWLSDTIQWQTMDAYSVKATFQQQSVVLHMSEQGQPTHVTAERYMEDHGHYRLAPWSVQVQEYQEVNGMRIPTRVEVTWHLASGDFSWFRCKITEIEYNQSGKVTRF